MDRYLVVGWGSSSGIKNGCQGDIGLAYMVEKIHVGLEREIGCYILVNSSFHTAVVRVARFVGGT